MFSAPPALGRSRAGAAKAFEGTLDDAVFESIPPDEQLHIDGLIASLRGKMQREYAGRRTLRDAHPKMHGCVQARFHVHEGLEASLRVGLFREPATYPCWVRFSNQAGTVGDDRGRDIRGIAMKLVGVEGAKLMEGAEDSRTHDLILISTDVFVTKDVAEFDGLIKALIRGRLSLVWFLVRHLRVAYNLLTSLRRCTSPLSIPYFSVVPYLFGKEPVKYVLRPTTAGGVARAPRRGPDQLRHALAAQLSDGAASFDFFVQSRSNPRSMPIEDPGVRWPIDERALHKVATLEIPAQTFDTPQRREFGDDLSFDPWRCLPEHRPLGGISRARRQVYRALSEFRHQRNDAPTDEPEA